MDPIAGFNLSLAGYQSKRTYNPQQTSFENTNIRPPYGFENTDQTFGVEPPQTQPVTPLEVISKLNEEITGFGKKFRHDIDHDIQPTQEIGKEAKEPSLINTLVETGKNFFNSLFAGQALVLAGVGDKEAGIFKGTSGQDYASIAERINSNLDLATRELEQLKDAMRVHVGSSLNSKA